MTYIEADTILANLLWHINPIEGISRRDIDDFCCKFKKNMNPGDYVYFDISKDSIKKVLHYYNDYFLSIGENIFPYKSINPDYFNGKLDKKSKIILDKTIAQMISERR